MKYKLSCRRFSSISTLREGSGSWQHSFSVKIKYLNLRIGCSWNPMNLSLLLLATKSKGVDEVIARGMIYTSIPQLHLAQDQLLVSLSCWEFRYASHRDASKRLSLNHILKIDIYKLKFSSIFKLLQVSSHFLLALSPRKMTAFHIHTCICTAGSQSTKWGC